MAESSSRVKIHHPNGDIDRLSCLPNNVIETILKCLSLKDAVRTRVLSRAWRDELSVVPQLEFDYATFRRLEGQDQSDYDNELVQIINQVFLLHHGEINNFELSVDLTCCPRRMDVWIRYLSRHPIEKFVLHMKHGSSYKLPSSFFLIKRVTHLELLECIFNPPPSFSGYNKLTTLHLQHVVFTDNGLQQLVTLCTLLKRLDLTSVDCDSLRLNHQKLVELEIDCERMNLYVENAPLLAEVRITFSCYDDIQHDDYNIVDLFGNVPNLRSLDLVGSTLKQLSARDIPVSLPSLHLVSNLFITINFIDKQQLLASFCIFRSLVVLRELNVEPIFDNFDGDLSADEFWQAQHSQVNFSQLKIMRMIEFVGSTSEIRFIEFILANAPSLESMHIEFKYDVIGKEHTFVRLLSLPRSSVKARIFIE